MCMCVCVYIYIYIYIHTHMYVDRAQLAGDRETSDDQIIREIRTAIFRKGAMIRLETIMELNL